MFAFLFVILTVMIGLDAVWWVWGLRLAKGRSWRFLISIFMAAEMAGLLLMIGGRLFHIDSLRHSPKAVFSAVVIWHFFGLAAVLVLGIARVSVWLLTSIRRVVRAQHPGVPPADTASLTRREFVGGAAALAPPIFTIGLTSVALAQLNHFRVRRLALSIPALPQALDGLTIAHVSDIHVGRLTSGRVLGEMVRATNNLRADLVLMTGDLINDALSDLSEGISLIKQMEGRYGLWLIEGNHDLIENGAEFERRVKAAGIPFLLNESAVAQVRGWPVQFFGLRWTRGDTAQRDAVTGAWVRELMKERQPDAFPILLAHHPHAFDAAVAAELPLTLSGHTHGGQLMLDSQRGFGPLFFRYWSGLYARGSSQMIVSNGVGNWFPLRINAPAEIVHVTLHRSETTAGTTT